MSSWFLLIIVTMVLGFGTQAYINSSYRKYASVPNGVLDLYGRADRSPYA